jgi:dihydroflavonol-4-reductase
MYAQGRAMSKTVLITGISGFIAKHVALAFLETGYRVRGTVRAVPLADQVRRTIGRYADATGVEIFEADLASDAGWDRAVDGCDAVAHLASPFTIKQPRDEDEVIRPAVQGTQRIMRAAMRAGVKGFVMTSGGFAASAGHGLRTTPYTEEDWAKLDGRDVNAYKKSKVLAERAARELIASSGTSMHFASIAPGFVLGPLLDDRLNTALTLIQLILRGKYPAMPRLHLPISDVRDVAKAHVAALRNDLPQCGRYFAGGGGLWIVEIAKILKSELGPAAKKVSTRAMPDLLFRAIALVDPGARFVVHDLGRQHNYDSRRATRELGIAFRAPRQTVVDTGRSLVNAGLA